MYGHEDDDGHGQSHGHSHGGAPCEGHGDEHDGVLKGVAVCCTMSQGVAGCCRVSQGVAWCCRVLQNESHGSCDEHGGVCHSVALMYYSVALPCCCVLPCVTVCCIVLQCITGCCRMLQWLFGRCHPPHAYTHAYKYLHYTYTQVTAILTGIRMGVRYVRGIAPSPNPSPSLCMQVS